MSILHGRKLIISVDGTAIAGAKSCSINILGDSIETASPITGTWKTFIAGRKAATITAGGTAGSVLACNYAYMFLTQHRFTLDTYVMPNVMHYLRKTTIGNSVTKRIVGIGFDLWNDIVTLTAQGSSTL